MWSVDCEQVGCLFDHIPFSHWQDLCKSEASKEAALATWSATWVRPICGALSSPQCTQVKYANITQVSWLSLNRTI
jgi:hypothetical protein